MSTTRGQDRFVQIVSDERDACRGRLARIAAIIEGANNHRDGTDQEMTRAEIREIYRLAKGSAK